MRGLAIFVLFCLPLLAQVEEDPSYEGQPVASVNLASDPRINLENYRGLLQQAAGQPFSWGRVRASIAALKDSKRFSRVELQVKPEAAGLDLTFVLEPAFYLGLIEFPGATKIFTYTRLLQIVNLPNEELYQKERITEARAALLKFFSNNGFYQSSIETETTLEDPHQLANVTFNIRLGKRARIGKVEITGAAPPIDDKLLHAVQGIRAVLTRAALKPGKTFTLERQKAAINLLKRQLSSQRYLANRLSLAPPVYHADTNHVDLAI